MDSLGGPPGSHRYGVIHLHDNATAVIGNSYGTLEGFGGADPTQQQPNPLGYRGLPGEFGTIIIKTLKLFDSCKASVKEFRRLKKAHKYDLHVDVQKTIFKTAIRALLLPYTGGDVAEQMLLDPRHLGWTTDGMLVYLRQRLGDGVDTVQRTLEFINSDLMAVGGFICERVPSGGNSTRSIASPLIDSRPLKKSTRGCQLTQEVVVEALQDLKTHVKKFRSHLQQCTQQQERVHVATLCAKSKLKVNRYQRVQEAARDLYQAFGRACQQHPKHRARLHLQALSENKEHVQFSLLLSESGALDSRTSISDMAFLRLTIESQINGVDQDYEACVTVEQRPSLKRTRQVSDDESKMKKSSATRQRRVAFAPSTNSIKLSSLARVRASEIFPNFCISGRLCLHMKDILSHGGLDGVPFGYLHNQGCSKHLISLSRAQRPDSQSLHKPPLRSSGKLSPLKILFQTVERRHRMSKTDLTSFAKQLAIAVLQYHATPWLESLDSDSVLIFDRRSSYGGLNERSNDGITNSPSDSYLEVSIDNPRMTARTPITDRSRTLIRNWIIFSLGVILLELAYQKPLRDLQEPDDVDPHNEHNTDFYTADRLQKEIAADTEMGGVYAEVVRKCIHCDFGHGFDLSASKLQEGYYVDVIQELEKIETGMKSLGL